MRIAVYPGSFDPVTKGHIDIIERSAKIADKLYVAVFINNEKKPLFTMEERKQLLRRVLGHLDNVEIVAFEGLLVNFVKQVNADVIIKGLRDSKDFEYEFQMAHANRIMYDGAETLFMPSSPGVQYLSSSIVREIARYNGNLDGLVPECIQKDIYDKIGG